MPADTKAVAYEWFMTNERIARVVRFRWEPEGGVITSSMGVGRMMLQSRDSTDNDSEWETVQTTSAWGPMPWVVAQNLARGEGFTVEVPIYEDN